MKIHLTGVGNAHHINTVLDLPACPRQGETMQLPDEPEWVVRTVTYTPLSKHHHDAYVVIGPPTRWGN